MASGIIDAEGFPHILEAIVAASPRAALLTLRSVSKHMQALADAELYRHIELNRGGWMTTANSLPLPLGGLYSPGGRLPSLGPVLGLDAPARVKAYTRVLDINARPATVGRDPTHQIPSLAVHDAFESAWNGIATVRRNLASNPLPPRAAARTTNEGTELRFLPPADTVVEVIQFANLRIPAADEMVVAQEREAAMARAAARRAAAEAGAGTGAAGGGAGAGAGAGAQVEAGAGAAGAAGPVGAGAQVGPANVEPAAGPAGVAGPAGAGGEELDFPGPVAAAVAAAVTAQAVAGGEAAGGDAAGTAAGGATDAGIPQSQLALRNRLRLLNMPEVFNSRPPRPVIRSLELHPGGGPDVVAYSLPGDELVPRPTEQPPARQPDKAVVHILYDAAHPALGQTELRHPWGESGPRHVVFTFSPLPPKEDTKPVASSSTSAPSDTDEVQIQLPESEAAARALARLRLRLGFLRTVGIVAAQLLHVSERVTFVGLERIDPQVINLAPEDSVTEELGAIILETYRNKARMRGMLSARALRAQQSHFSATLHLLNALGETVGHDMTHHTTNMNFAIQDITARAEEEEAIVNSMAPTRPDEDEPEVALEFFSWDGYRDLVGEQQFKDELSLPAV